MTKAKDFAHAGFISRLFFTWISPLMTKGITDDRLEPSDLPNLHDTDRIDNVSDKLQKSWDNQLKSPKPRLRKAFTGTLGRRFWGAAVPKVIHDIMLFVPPLVLQQLVLFIQDPSSAQFDHYGYILPAILMASLIISSFCIHVYFHSVMRVAMLARAGLCSLIYTKSLRLSPSAWKKFPPGKVQNIMSTDAEALNGLLSYLHNIWSAPLQIIVSLVLLFRLVGVAAFAGLGIMIIMVPITGKISKEGSCLLQKIN
ncbi:hypothetical protein GEMRC1_011409 [Eukaryota sp. GEM-RC1]